MQHIYDDGGRAAAGYKGHAGDCVARAIAIVAQLPYQQVYDALAKGNETQRKGKRERGAQGKRTARDGISVRRKWFKDYMRSLGFEYVPTMAIGSGCQVHLHDGELPAGRLVVQVSKHYTAVIDGVIRDTHDPQRDAHMTRTLQPGEALKPGEWTHDGKSAHKIIRRCVYGYWKMRAAA